MLQDIDGEFLSLAKGVQASGCVGQAYQDQRRGQGNRRKGVQGNADGYVVVGEAGNDGDAGGKKAQGLAEFAGVERHGLVFPGKKWMER